MRARGAGLVQEIPADRRTDAPRQAEVRGELGYLDSCSAIKTRQADGGIQIRGRDPDLRGRSGQPPLGLPYVGPAPDERRAVAYRQKRHQLRRPPARLDVPWRFGRCSPEYRRKLEQRGAPLPLESRNTGRDLRDQGFCTPYIVLRVAPRLVTMRGDIGLVRHDIEGAMRDIDLLAQRAHRGVGPRGFRGDHDFDSVASRGHRVGVRIGRLDGPVHPAE